MNLPAKPQVRIFMNLAASLQISTFYEPARGAWVRTPGLAMIQGVLKKIFGSRNERLLKQYGRIVREVNALEADIARLSDDQLRAKTEEFRGRVAERVGKVQQKQAEADTDEAPARETQD